MRRWLTSTGCTLLLLLGLVASDAQTSPTADYPVSTADPAVSDVKQMSQVIRNLGSHLDRNSRDTRFVIDPNLHVLCSARALGILHFSDDGSTKITRIETGMIIAPCWVLTSYHGIEGREIIESNKLPRKARRVQFSAFWQGSLSGFRTDVGGTVVDPHVLDLRHRLWGADMVLIKLDRSFSADIISPISLNTPFDQELSSNFDSANLSDSGIRFLDAGFPEDYIVDHHRVALLGDFCTAINAAPGLGLNVNCTLTSGMSGGALFGWKKLAGKDSLKLEAYGLNTQSAMGDGLFAKNSGSSSVIAPFTPAIIDKIHATIAREKCPSEGVKS